MKGVITSKNKETIKSNVERKKTRVRNTMRKQYSRQATRQDTEDQEEYRTRKINIGETTRRI